MAIEIPIMQVSTEKYRSTDISGHYADMAKAFGGYGERVETPDQIIPAIQKGIQVTQEGTFLHYLNSLQQRKYRFQSFKSVSSKKRSRNRLSETRNQEGVLQGT